MENRSGLNINLVENIVPTIPGNPPAVNASKRRQASNNRRVNVTRQTQGQRYERHSRSNRYKSNSAISDGASSHYNHHQQPHHLRNTCNQYRDPGISHKFSKQQFLQANCQFVVLDGHDYTVHKVDPDWPVDWDCIEEVRFKQSASTETTCPICLEPPIAAKITRCGHIYCWTCILHYLSLSDENCRQCPICFEPVYRNDLRSVVSHSFINYSVDDEITMRLMIRKKGCVEVEPYRGDVEHNPGMTSSEPSCKSQANLVIVNPLTVVSDITTRERNELLSKLEADKDEPEVCFIEQAMSALEKKIERLQQSGTRSPEHLNHENDKECQASMRTDVESSKSYLFYQCSDGQHVYLNPFSTKMLTYEYGNVESCPLEIQAKILQMDWVSMSEAWRKRFRYLEHLPLTCEFRLIEIDFENSKIVSPETFRVFENQIKKRKQERDRRLKEERKREKIIQVEQNRKIYGIQPSLKINLNNRDQFPSVSDERYLGLSQLSVRTRTLTGGESNDIDTSDEEQINRSVDNTNSSLAQASNLESTDPQITTTTNLDNRESSRDLVAGVALSFRDIQLQEEAISSKEANNTESASSAWGASKKQSGASNASQSSSSFAQLLVKAKANDKQWTRNISSTSNANIQFPSLAGSSQHRTGQPKTDGHSDDDGGEELRAPANDFTISDFIDMNIKSGKRKGKLTKNANTKKG